MMMKDEWLRAALTDDAVVVELLFRLKRGSSDESPTPSTPSLPLPPLAWGLRLPRSKAANNFRKDSTATRFSPTTPLSWSGGAAASSFSDSGHDESSVSRSKGGTSTNEVSNNCTTNKRSRKKKTFTELKEEESILLKERVHLKRELASLHDTLEDQRVRSNNFKRIKFDLNMQSGGTHTTSCKAETAVRNQCSSGMEVSTADESVVSNSCEEQETIIDASKSCFVLPDLNMMPEEEEIAAEIL